MKFFSKSTPPEFDALKKILAQNATDRARLDAFAQAITALDSDVTAARARFTATLDDDDGEKLVAALVRRDNEKAARSELYQLASNAISERIVSRTRQPLLDALAAFNRLCDGKVRTSEARDAERETELGIAARSDAALAAIEKQKERASYLATRLNSGNCGLGEVQDALNLIGLKP
jgi:hypothetical protein